MSYTDRVWQQKLIDSLDRLSARITLLTSNINELNRVLKDKNNDEQIKDQKIFDEQTKDFK